ncbi:MAG: hypothetical protein U1E76_18635 [Planctomycetota bacterium]
MHADTGHPFLGIARGSLLAILGLPMALFLLPLLAYGFAVGAIVRLLRTETISICRLRESIEGTSIAPVAVAWRRPDRR